jgi:hypothetical protein
VKIVPMENASKLNSFISLLWFVYYIHQIAKRFSNPKTININDKTMQASWQLKNSLPFSMQIIFIRWNVHRQQCTLVLNNGTFTVAYRVF